MVAICDHFVGLVLIVFATVADAAAVGLFGWDEKFSEFVEDHLYVCAVLVCLGFEDFELVEDIFVGEECFAEFDKDIYDLDAHSDCPFTFQYIGEHQDAVFREGVRAVFGMGTAV